MKHIANGNVSARARSLVLASILIALEKPNGSLRPIAMGELLYKLTGRYMSKIHDSAICEAFKSVQTSLGSAGGSEVAVHKVRAALTASPSTPFARLPILLSDDLPNAYNDRCRARMLAILHQHSELAHLFRLAHFAYGAASDLYIDA